MIWFTGDTHIGHGNILKYDNLPFESIYNHDEYIVSTWNNQVKNEDLVFHLGDFAISYPKYARDTLRRLKGKIHFLRGSHDKILDREELPWETIKVKPIG